MTVRLDREVIAMRAAKELSEGMYVNLGVGLPGLVPNFIPEGLNVVFQSENGILGYGRIVETEEEMDADLINAGGQPVVLKPEAGPCFFDSATAFTMIRGEHLDLVFLGAYQVSGKGDLANWSVNEKTEKALGSIGGAMDLAYGGAGVLDVIEGVVGDVVAGGVGEQDGTEAGLTGSEQVAEVGERHAEDRVAVHAGAGLDVHRRVLVVL